MMSKLTLDEVEWKNFQIRDLFETFEGNKGLQTPTGAYIPKECLTDGKIPRITVKDTNNGVDSYCFSKEKNYRTFNNFISVSFLGSVFYHHYEASLDMKVHALIPLKINLNSYIAKFLIVAITNSTMNSSYGNQLSSTDLIRLRLMLPVDKHCNPNWKFMENYIKQEEKKQVEKIRKYYSTKLEQLSNENLVLEEVEWKEFKFFKIFNRIQRGKRLKKSDHIDGLVPYISSTGLKNGIDGFVGNTENVRRFENNLTVANSGSVGSCFYHGYQYVASDHVTALSAKKGDKYSYLFLSTIIKRFEEKYSFNREINDKRIKKEIIVLPTDSCGNPHWQYMSNYMKCQEIKLITKILKSI